MDFAPFSAWVKPVIEIAKARYPELEVKEAFCGPGISFVELRIDEGVQLGKNALADELTHWQSYASPHCDPDTRPLKHWTCFDHVPTAIQKGLFQ